MARDSVAACDRLPEKQPAPLRHRAAQADLINHLLILFGVASFSLSLILLFAALLIDIRTLMN